MITFYEGGISVELFRIKNRNLVSFFVEWDNTDTKFGFGLDIFEWMLTTTLNVGRISIVFMLNESVPDIRKE